MSDVVNAAMSAGVVITVLGMLAMRPPWLAAPLRADMPSMEQLPDSAE